MNINKEIWQPETLVVDENNSYHDADFSASSGKITKTFKELCINSETDFFRNLDETNIVGEYVSDKRANPALLTESQLIFKQIDGKIVLQVYNNQIGLEELPFRFCTQNGLKDIELSQPYGRSLVDESKYESINKSEKADELIRFLLDFPIKKFLNTVYVSVKHLYREQREDLQYGFFEIPEEFYQYNGICTLQNYLNIIKEKSQDERNDYIIDNWWIKTDYFNSKKEIVPYFYNIFLQTTPDNIHFSRQLINVATREDIQYRKEKNNQSLRQYYYYYQNFYFMEYKNDDFDFFHNSSNNVISTQDKINVIKEKSLGGAYSYQSNIRMLRLYWGNTNTFRTSVDLGGDFSENLFDFEEGFGKKVGKIFIGRYKNSNQVLEIYKNDEKLSSNNNLFVMLKIWQPEEIEMLMNDMICCWSAQELSQEYKNLFFAGELDNLQIKNIIKVPVVKNSYYITGENNYGKNAYDCLPNNILDFQEKSDIDKILPEPNFQDERSLDIVAKNNYDDIFQLQKNVSLWGIKEKENGKYLVSDSFPYSYYRNNQINSFIGMIRTKIAKPTVVLEGDKVKISGLGLIFEDVVKKSAGENEYNLAEININDFLSDNNIATVDASINQIEQAQNNIQTKELDYGFYRGEVASWSENNYETIVFKINFSYKFQGNLVDGDKAIFSLIDEDDPENEVMSEPLIYHSETQTYPEVYLNLKAYDQNKNKKRYKICYYQKKNGESLCNVSVAEDNKKSGINIDDNNITINLIIWR